MDTATARRLSLQVYEQVEKSIKNWIEHDWEVPELDFQTIMRMDPQKLLAIASRLNMAHEVRKLLLSAHAAGEDVATALSLFPEQTYAPGEVPWGD